MIRTYEIDLDDKLVEDSSKIFESLGSDIDSAIKIFLTQSVLRKGFPFEIAVPDEKNEEIKKENMIESEAVQSISEKSGSVENNESGSKTDNLANPEISSAGEIKNQNPDAEIPDSVKIAALEKDLSELENPEKAEKFDSENQETQETQPQNSSDEENVSGEENQNPDAENSEDEDETAPENLFAQWTVETAGNDDSSGQKISGESEVRS